MKRLAFLALLVPLAAAANPHEQEIQRALIQRDGADVGTLADGALIGEATVLDGSHATGTVILTSNARLWFVPAAALRAYLAANPDIAAVLHEGFARALRGKLASANTRIADMPPLS